MEGGGASRAHPRGELMRTGMRQGDVAIDVFFVQLIDGYGRSCAHAETCFAVLDIVVDMPVASND